jgi:alkylated DNA repair dioxygenase AlkB
MNTISLIPGSNLISNFIDTNTILTSLMDIDYDRSMRARWTASFGKSYDYSGNTYPYVEMPDFLANLIPDIATLVGFTPNNCLINLYHDGKSSMGYHSDNTDILADNTGVVIISIGATRTLRFRNILDNTNIIDYVLDNGSIFYMTGDLQNDWLHSIPKSDTDDIRISLTFREIR